MMLGFIGFQTVKTLLLGIPESAGLLAFGVGLTATAVLIRWFLGRSEICTGSLAFVGPLRRRGHADARAAGHLLQIHQDISARRTGRPPSLLSGRSSS